MTELEALRSEVESLRSEVASLRATAAAHACQPPATWWPGQPPTVCGGAAGYNPVLTFPWNNGAANPIRYEPMIPCAAGAAPPQTFYYLMPS